MIYIYIHFKKIANLNGPRSTYDKKNLLKGHRRIETPDRWCNWI
jgi:hypothetical protein